MKNNALHWIGVIGVVLLLASLACGPGGEPTATPEPPPPTVTKAVEKPATPEPPPPTATPEPVSLAITSLQDVRNAVIQIEAQGSFVDPQVGLQLNAAGFGSGFIIDESGIAVTNNHVVTGAALLRVYVGGESEPRNARVLGASECSDLAVIDLEGEGYPYLEWYEGAIPVGLDVYAAGFPLADPEYTLTRGIVSKERAGGESDWASVDYVVEHDATINPGNSGGPLVSADGKVVGVNYASAAGVSQYFAIARDEALEVIDQLRSEQDVTSIGVNGIAVYDGSISGIWVSSVKSGSPADRAGVQGGDIITAIEGFVLATDGTMADYCDILRSHNPDDVLAIEVLRYSTEEYLAGQLNGRELEQSFSFANELGDEVGVAGEAAGPGYSSYTLVTDDSSAIQVEIPVEWDDFNGGNWTRDDRIIGAAISASSSLDDFWNTFSTPGIWFGASEELAYEYYDAATFLDTLADYSDSCVYEGRFEYEDPAYSGLYDYYSNCGSAGSNVINVVAFPPDYAYLVWVQTQVVDDADLEALDRILNSFYVIGELPSEGSSSGGGTASGALSMGEILIGEPVAGMVREAQDHNWSLWAGGGEVVDIVLTPLDDDADVTLSVMAPSGSMLLDLFDEAFSGEAEKAYGLELNQAGEYLVIVSEYWDSAANYKLEVAYGGGASDDYELLDMGSIYYGEVRQVSLPAGKYVHYWAFDGVAGDVVTIIVSPLSSGADVLLGLMDSDGNLLWELDDGVGDEMEMIASYVLPATDSYGILAAEYWEAAADYEVSLLLE
jgi:serine protease Do